MMTEVKASRLRATKLSKGVQLGGGMPSVDGSGRY